MVSLLDCPSTALAEHCCREFACGNTFGATAFSTCKEIQSSLKNLAHILLDGGFWLSFGAIYVPWFGILDAYQEADAAALADGVA